MLIYHINAGSNKSEIQYFERNKTKIRRNYLKLLVLPLYESYKYVDISTGSWRSI